MKIKLHIVLYCNGGIPRPRFEKTIDYEVCPNNFESVLSGSIRVLIDENAHDITFQPRDWDKQTEILNCQAKMHSSECKAYLNDLQKSGWQEIVAKPD